MGESISASWPCLAKLINWENCCEKVSSTGPCLVALDLGLLLLLSRYVLVVSSLLLSLSTVILHSLHMAKASKLSVTSVSRVKGLVQTRHCTSGCPWLPDMDTLHYCTRAELCQQCATERSKYKLNLRDELEWTGESSWRQLDQVAR